MSSGDELDSDEQIEEILHQRRRKGQLQYLVRWVGLGKSHESWEPAAVLSKMPKLLKAFQAQEKERRSRSRSRGRRRSSSRSRSRSSTRKNVGSKKEETSVMKTVGESSVKKEEMMSGSKRQSRSRAKQESDVSETDKTEIRSEASTTRKKGSAAKKVDSEKPSEPSQLSETEMLRSRLAVQQVQNDQKPESEAVPANNKEPWIWWFADHAVLGVFIIISIVALSFCLDSITGSQKQMIPNFSVLRQRLTETYEHMSGSVIDNFNTFLEFVSAWRSGVGEKPAAAAPGQ